MQYKTKTQIIYEKLKDEINGGIYLPGDRIVISEIAKDNNISEIPVREAIRTLESENLVELIPNVGPIVSKIKEEDIVEHFMIRALLEGYATRLSIDYINTGMLDELDELVNKMDSYIEEGDLIEYGKLNKHFHLSIYSCMPYKMLYKMIKDMWEEYERTRIVFMISPCRCKASNNEHREILRLIRNKEYDNVEAYLRNHKIKSSHELLKYVSNTKDSTPNSVETENDSSKLL